MQRKGKLRPVLLFVLLLALLPSARAGDWSGTWRGSLQGEANSINFELTFSDAGYWIYTYRSKSGARQVELTSEGQKVQYVPGGGGVKTVIARKVEKSGNTLSYTLSESFERASNGYLTQNSSTTAYRLELTDSGLKVQLVTRASSHFGDKDMTTGGQPEQASFEGLLQKVR